MEGLCFVIHGIYWKAGNVPMNAPLIIMDIDVHKNILEFRQKWLRLSIFPKGKLLLTVIPYEAHPYPVPSSVSFCRDNFPQTQVWFHHGFCCLKILLFNVCFFFSALLYLLRKCIVYVEWLLYTKNTSIYMVSFTSNLCFWVRNMKLNTVN